MTTTGRSGDPDSGSDGRRRVGRSFARRAWRASPCLVAGMLVALAGSGGEAWGKSCGALCKGLSRPLRRECVRDCKDFKKAPLCRGQRGTAKRQCKEQLARDCVRACANEWQDETAEGRANREHCQFVCKECLTRDPPGGKCIEGTGPERFIRCCGRPGEPECCIGSCCAGTCCLGLGGTGQCCTEGQTCGEGSECVSPPGCVASLCEAPLIVPQTCCPPPSDGRRPYRCEFVSGCMCCPAGFACDFTRGCVP
jgi:hypothetical protein